MEPVEKSLSVEAEGVLPWEVAPTAPVFSDISQREPTDAYPEQDGFRALVGEAGWWRLPAAVRERFGQAHSAQPIVYCGTMEVVRASAVGWMLAQIYRFFGTPLAPYRGVDVPMTARVYHSDAKGGTVWERTYAFPGRKPITVTSTKVLRDSGELWECVGGGFGMKLNVFESNRKLHFLSTEYFLTVGGRYVRLPEILTPGRALVIHSDEGGGRFRFTMSIRHPLLGETFFQDGVFREPN